MSIGKITVACAVCACVGVLAGFGASDIITAKRFVVLNEDGAPVVVVTVDAIGGGVLIVNDASGKEVLAVRGTRVLVNGQTLGAVDRPGAPLASADRGGRVAQLLRIEPLPPDPQVWKEID